MLVTQDKETVKTTAWYQYLDEEDDDEYDLAGRFCIND